MPRPDPGDTRAQLAKELRLWGLSAVCALAGALTVWRTNSVAYGVAAFLISLAVLGPALIAFERRRRR